PESSPPEPTPSLGTGELPPMPGGSLTTDVAGPLGGSICVLGASPTGSGVVAELVMLGATLGPGGVPLGLGDAGAVTDGPPVAGVPPEPDSESSAQAAAKLTRDRTQSHEAHRSVSTCGSRLVIHSVFPWHPN